MSFLDPDSVEVVRLAVARLLREGVGAAQSEAAGRDDAADYDISVGIDAAAAQYVDNARNPFPLVDVHLDSVRTGAGSASVNRKNRTARLEVLCMAEGNSAGGQSSWRRANSRAWKVARVVRRILEAEENAYLGLRGVVSSARISEMQSGQMEADAAVSVCAVKVSLDVDFVEGVEVASGAAFESAVVEIESDKFF